MAGLMSSRNTREWNGSTREHYQIVGVEASTSIFVGGMVAMDASGYGVPAQEVSGTSNLRKLHVLGVCENVYYQGTLAPGVNAVNQSSATYNGAMAGAAGFLSVEVVTGIFGYDYDSTITSATPIGAVCFAKDDHTLTLGTLVANTTSVTTPASGVPINSLGTPWIVPGTFDAYSSTGGGGTHYKEGVDFIVDYQAGLLITNLSGGAIGTSATVYVTYYYGGLYPLAGMFYGLDSSQAYVNFKRQGLGLA